MPYEKGIVDPSRVIWIRKNVRVIVKAICCNHRTRRLYRINGGAVLGSADGCEENAVAMPDAMNESTPKNKIKGFMVILPSVEDAMGRGEKR